MLLLLLQLTDGTVMYRHSAPFKGRLDEWTQYLSSSLEIIENWLVVQSLWVHVEAVFSAGGDVARQLPAEARRFSNVDKSWQRVVQRVRATPNVVDCCVQDTCVAQMLPHLLDQLELCHKSLAGYIHTAMHRCQESAENIFLTSISCR